MKTIITLVAIAAVAVLAGCASHEPAAYSSYGTSTTVTSK